MKYFRLLFAFLFFIVFCSCENRMVKQSLRAAGNNRQELEKVIEHFSQNPADSLKLKAAQFLIGNMPGHFSFIDDGLMAYYDSVANVSAGQLFADRYLHYCMPNILYEADSIDIYLQDVEAITSEMLIAHINARYGGGGGYIIIGGEYGSGNGKYVTGMDIFLKSNSARSRASIGLNDDIRIGDTFEIIINKEPSFASEELTDIKVYINGMPREGSSLSIFAKNPTNGTIKVEALGAKSRNKVSAETNLVIRYPNKDEVYNMFVGKMWETWNTSVMAGTEEGTYEYAVYMYVDTRAGYAQPFFDCQHNQEPYPYELLVFPAPFPYNKEEDGCHLVGIFHTHPAWDKAPWNLPRPVGKSENDKNGLDGDLNMPAWVMDYTANTYITRDGRNYPTINEAGANNNRGKFLPTEPKSYGGDGREL